MLLIGRFVRFLIAVIFFVLGYAVAQFANGNREVIAISITPYSFQVPVYLLALVPLTAGLALGWLYTVPARTHEFADHWRSWRTVRRMEKENKELRRSLDKVLDLPEETVAAAKALPQVERAALAAPRPASEPALVAEPVVVHEVKEVARPAAKDTHKVADKAPHAASNGRAKAEKAARPDRVRAARVRPHAPAGNGHSPRRAPEPVPAPAS